MSCANGKPHDRVQSWEFWRFLVADIPFCSLQCGGWALTLAGKSLLRGRERGRWAWLRSEAVGTYVLAKERPVRRSALECERSVGRLVECAG
jgi:hypothetical protein